MTDQQIIQLETALEAKENERNQLMVAYKKLIGEREMIDIQLHSLREEVSNLR
jgi:hypothetical protein